MNTLTQRFALLILAYAIPVIALGGFPIMPFPPDMVAPLAGSLDPRNATLPQLRGMLSASSVAAHNAAVALINAGDDATIQRLVYAFKRGNARSAQILYDCASPKVIPYLLEDVAHGSMAEIPGAVSLINDGVRVAATQIMAVTLSKLDGLPEESAAWLEETAFRSGYNRVIVPEKSKVLLEWWEHNGDAVLEGRASEAKWLPDERKITPRTFEAWSAKKRANLPPPPPPAPPISPHPPSELPVKVDESFERWVARVADPKQLNVTWVTVDYDSGLSVQSHERETQILNAHDEPFNRSGNPIGTSSQPLANSNSSLSASESKITSSKTWSTIVFLVVTAGGLLWLLLKRSSSS